MNAIERAFRAGFRSGFSVTREGFNGGCVFDHLAPDVTDLEPDTWRQPIAGEASALEQAAMERFTALSSNILPVNRCDLPCPNTNEGGHGDPDNSGQCIYCGAILDLGPGESDPPREVTNSLPQHPQK